MSARIGSNFTLHQKSKRETMPPSANTANTASASTVANVATVATVATVASVVYSVG
ncbi:hypothetical protein NYE70_13070 [Paenibacillus sp. FSL R5-0407]|uniref:hypothetical protein n=1 Tax=Paenibacillus sp. FSL R5-0407 TaxID=2975320 RepID=UPI0030F61517